ncbi:MAG: bifunctional diguanylate cyclase/phosphodiesterase [Arcobacter sp.]|nr:bifunctional diguanylate cyclase/phosphodiesterase [Arcobacter sp.]
MRYDVFIIDDNITFNNFKEYAQSHIRNAKITLFSDIEELINEIEFTDILVLNINSINSFNKIKELLKVDTYIIFIINDNSDLAKIQNSKGYDILYNPLDLDKLVTKINNFTKNINNQLLIKKEEEFSNSIINNINYPIFSIDNDQIIFSNNHFYELLNCYSLDEITRKYKNIKNIFEKEEDCITNLTNELLENSKSDSLKVCIKDAYDKKRFFSVQKIHLTHNNTNIIILNDISHEVEHKHELYKLLYTDNLTKLPNRAKLIEDLQNKTLKLKAVAILNINSFKEVNDFFGHKIGDSILIDVAKIMAQNIKISKSLKLYKFPSDIYCITYSKDKKDEFITLIKEIIDTIYKKVFTFEHYEIDIRISAGISFSDKNNKLITADIALQAAKKNHKDYLVFFEELDKFQEYENNMLWTKKLKTAFINDNIEVFFQPIVNNKTLIVDKYECLVRLKDDEGKIISPFFFLDISKKSNQYTKLTKIVIEKSFKKFQDLPFEFSVNISYEDIENADFLDFIKEMLKKYNVADKVVFEILEDENVKNYNLLISFIDEIKSLGCKVAIDDFGSGYSNFEHLLKMNVDYLKIDSSIIKNVAKDENSYKITKTIVDFAKSLNLKTIAEFVENEEIYNIIKEMGADYSQGYYFSAPLAEPSAIEFKKKKENE